MTLNELVRPSVAQKCVQKGNCVALTKAADRARHCPPREALCTFAKAVFPRSRVTEPGRLAHLAALQGDGDQQQEKPEPARLCRHHPAEPLLPQSTKEASPARFVLKLAPAPVTFSRNPWKMRQKARLDRSSMASLNWMQHQASSSTDPSDELNGLPGRVEEQGCSGSCGRLGAVVVRGNQSHRTVLTKFRQMTHQSVTSAESEGG